MSDAAATASPTPGAPLGTTPQSPMAGAVPPGAVRARLSDLGTHGEAPSFGQMVPLDGPEPANTQQAREQPPEPELPAEPQLEGEQPAEEQAAEGALTPEQIQAKYEEWTNSPDLPAEFADKVLWVKDRDGNPVPMRVADVERHTMLYRDYQHKTTELSKKTREVTQMEAGMQAFQRDLVSGDPQLAMKAMRWMGAEKSMHSMVVAYVQRMAELEGLSPNVRDHFIASERARDENEALKRQLAAREQQERQLAEQQAQTQGLDAPDIQHVMGHIEQRLPNICKELGVVESPAFDRLLGETLVRATEGERGPDGKWITAPTIQRGRTPTDGVLRQLVGEAKEHLQALIASAGGRQPPRSQQLPPPPASASVSGPAARPGARGNINQPQAARFSDLAGWNPGRRQ